VKLCDETGVYLRAMEYGTQPGISIERRLIYTKGEHPNKQLKTDILVYAYF